MKLTCQLLPAPRLRKSGALPILPPTLFHGLEREKFAFSLQYRVSQEECVTLREGVPYVKVYRYNPKHLCPKLNGYGDKGTRKEWSSCGSTYCTWFV